MTTTASSPSADKVHQIQATTTPEGEVKFALPIKPELVESVEAIDLDLMLTTTSGEKYILQQGALLATTNTESKLVFSNGDAMSAADQMKRMGVMKPVEGGSFRLASALTPEAADKVTGNEFGLGKDAQDTVAKIEKLLQSLESATQPSQNSEASNSSTAPGKNSAFKSNADPLASPAPGTPPKPDDTQNVSPVKVNDTPRSFNGSSNIDFDGLLITAAGSTNYDPAKRLKQVDLTQINIDKPIQVDLKNQPANKEVDLTKNQGTLTLPGVLNATKLELILVSGTAPIGFKINGDEFVDGKIVISDVKSLADLNLQVDWDAKGTTSQATVFEIGVAFFDGSTKLDYGSAPLNLVYGDTLPESKLDSNGNLKIFLSESGYSYNVTGTENKEIIKTGGGNDTLDGGLGVDTLIGGDGNDIYIVDSTTDTITETNTTNSGTDLVQSSVTYVLGSNLENLTLTGSEAINGTGNSANNIITGNAVANTLDGSAGVDTLIGGDGNDIYIVDSTTDTITETNTTNSGTDLVQSSVTYVLGSNLENLTLTGSEAINGTGNSANNIIMGNGGNNTLTGGAGTDQLIGGDGNDIYIVDSTTDTITETNTTNSGTDLVQSSVTYVLGSNLENLTLTGSEAINGTGNSANNIITGNGGNNTLTGGAGTDQLIGGDGNDIYIVDSTTDTITETNTTNSGTDLVQSSVTYVLGSNLENLTLTGSEAINGTGNSANNIITGNAVANTLDGSAGVDTLIGGDGNDIYIVDSTTDTITETNTTNSGTDLVQSSVTYVLGSNLENLTLTGSEAINGTGNSANNIITGNGGNNTLTGGAGTDQLIGGDGNDIYIVDSTTDTITETNTTNSGTDLVQSSVTYVLGSNLENLTLTGSEAINGTGNSANNIIMGNGGNNTLTGGAGTDQLIGGDGNDIYIVDSTTDTITETNTTNSGTDLVQSSVTYVLGSNLENLTLTGSEAINGTGNSANNIITGNGGNNTLTGGAGTDQLIGGDGNDIYIVDSTTDTITETNTTNSGTDLVQSSVTYVLGSNLENLTLTGSEAINGTGNSANNIITGNGGNNTLTGGAGTDQLIGGGGIDTASYRTSNSAVTVSLATGLGSGGDAEGDVLSSIANLVGSSSNDILTGDANDNTIAGGAGEDTINGGDGIDTVDYSTSTSAVSVNLALSTAQSGGDAAGDILNSIEKVIGSAKADNLWGTTGNETLIGGADNDTFYGSTGSDSIFGGTLTAANGSDTMSYSSSTNAVDVNLTLTTAQSGGDAQGDILSNISNLVGSAFNDKLTGTTAANKLEGGAGNDTLVGNGGADILVAGSGVDSLTGGTAGDTFDLATGNTSLADDKALGGGGIDTFKINAADLSTITSSTLIQGTAAALDTLEIKASSSGTIDLTGLDTNNFQFIDKLDVSTDNTSSSIQLNLSTIRSLVDPSGSSVPSLTIKLGNGDTINFIDDATNTHVNVPSSTTAGAYYISSNSALIAQINYTH